MPIKTADLVDPQSGYANIESARLYYEMAGEGPYLVLVHAGCADRRMWDAQFSSFARRYRVLRYDMRGYGNSPLLPGTFSNREDLNQLLDFLEIPQAHFIACSMGSLTVTDFALEYPEKTASLILVSPGLSGYQYEGPPPRPVLELIAARKAGKIEQAAELQARIWADGFKRAPDQCNLEIHELVRQMSFDALALQADAIVETGFLTEEAPKAAALPRLNKLTVPVLVFVGDMDDDSESEIADLLVNRIPSAQKIKISGSAHLPNMEKPGEFNRLALGFLRQM
jgi:2-hydroxy-6-oxonona-2,4-dienedioate hydrolase